MIADSPYQTSEPVLSPGEGALAGAAASLLMLPVLSLLRPLGGPSAADILARVGQVTISHGSPEGSGGLLAAGAIYALTGALLGLLYAVSQDRAPEHALFAVGLFYGIVIWAGSRVITAWIFGSVFRTALHSYTWFLACVLYGALLGGCAAWLQRHRPAAARVVQID